MKKSIFTLFSAVLMFLFVYQLSAQVPQAFNYQAVARDASGNMLANKKIGIEINIRQHSTSGTIVYTETFKPMTNLFGLFNIAVGTGIPTLGSFSAIDWSADNYWLEVEMDPTGEANYTSMGTSELLSVPYAMYAANASTSGTLISAFQPTGCQDLSSVTTSYQKIGDMGTFTKINTNTFIEINAQTVYYVGAFSGANGVVFELRVDNNETTIGNATLLVKSATTNIPGSLTGIFSGLSTGSHTISLWAKSVNGNANDAMWDPGCWNSDATNNVLVKEYY